MEIGWLLLVILPIHRKNKDSSSDVSKIREISSDPQWQNSFETLYPHQDHVGSSPKSNYLVLIIDPNTPKICKKNPSTMKP